MMIGKSIILSVVISSVTVVTVGLGIGYFGLGKPKGVEQSAAPREVHAPVARKASKIAISGQFKKDLGKRPDFVLGDRPIPFEANQEDQKSFLAGGTVEVVTVDGVVVASGGIADNGTFSLEIPPAPKYIVRAQNDAVSVSYAVLAGGLPDMKRETTTTHADAAHGEGAEHGAHGGAAKH